MKEPVCSKCKGLGFVDVKDGDREFVYKCDCQELSTLLTRCGKANIPKRFAGAELGGFFPEDNNSSQAKAKNVVQKFINDFPAVDKGLLLHGPTGVGKTHLLCIIVTELMKKHDKMDVYYIDWNDLVREMRTGEGPKTRDFASINKLVNKLVEVDLLVFDELAASQVSPWVHDHIYYLINRRYNENRISLFATNFYDKSENGQDSLRQRIGQRIRSRLYEMADSLEIRGMDFRQKHL